MEKESPRLRNKTPKKIRKNQIIKAKQYMNYINSQFDDRLSRIEKIKKSHENFERELEILQSGKSKHFSKKKIKSIVNNILQEPETAKASKELSELIEKYAKEIGIDATPSFLIFNDEKIIKIRGNQPLDVFRKAINELL